MTWLSAGQSTWQRDMVDNLLPDTCVISAPTYTPDSAGSNTLTFAAVAGGTVSCRLDPLENSTAKALMVELGREVMMRSRFLTVPYNAPLALDYRVVVNETTYEILRLEDDHSARIARRAIVARME